MEKYYLIKSADEHTVPAGEILNQANTIGEIHDGYHSFDELYQHRAVLLACVENLIEHFKIDCIETWKSKHHHDPEFPMYDGMFIVGMETPFGQITYHYDMMYWDMFKIKELPNAPQYDGHTPDDAVERLAKIASIIPIIAETKMTDKIREERYGIHISRD